MRCMRFVGQIFSTAPALLLLSACGDHSAGAYASGEYEPPDPAKSPAAKATSSAITGPDGQRVSQQTGSDAAIALPKGFSLYPQARVISNTVTRSGAASQSMLMFRSSADPADIVDYYREQAEKAGMDITIDLDLEDNFTIAGDRASDGTQMTVSASREVGEVYSTVMLNVVEQRGG